MLLYIDAHSTYHLLVVPIFELIVLVHVKMYSSVHSTYYLLNVLLYVLIVLVNVLNVLLILVVPLYVLIVLVHIIAIVLLSTQYILTPGCATLRTDSTSTYSS